MKIRVTGNAPKSITVITTKGFLAISKGASGGFDKEKDVLLVDDTSETIDEKNVDFPAGSFHIMMQNRATDPQEFHLQCIAQ